jgi:hypothetical protein
MANLKSQGCSIWMMDTTVSPNAYVELGQVVSISGPDGSTGEIDVTNLSSSAKEFIPSLPDWGSVSMDVVWDPTTASVNHDDIWTDFSAQTIGTYQIRLSDSPQTTLTFSAFPNQNSVTIGVDDKVGASIGLRITSAVTKA